MPEEEVPSTDAIRFTYGIGGDGTFGLIDGLAVSMTALVSDLLDPALGPFGGFWFELRDSTSAVLWREVSLHPLRGTVEVYGDDAELLPDALGDSTTTVVIPALDGAAVVALMGAPSGEPDGDAVEMLVHPFQVSP